MSARVYVGRLSYRASERDIEHFFRGYGRIRDIVLKNGFGFVASCLFFDRLAHTCYGFKEFRFLGLGPSQLSLWCYYDTVHYAEPAVLDKLASFHEWWILHWHAFDPSSEYYGSNAFRNLTTLVMLMTQYMNWTAKNFVVNEWYWNSHDVDRVAEWIDTAAMIGFPLQDVNQGGCEALAILHFHSFGLYMFVQ